jgi:hypothetical protein
VKWLAAKWFCDCRIAEWAICVCEFRIMAPSLTRWITAPWASGAESSASDPGAEIVARTGPDAPDAA